MQVGDDLILGVGWSIRDVIDVPGTAGHVESQHTHLACPHRVPPGC